MRARAPADDCLLAYNKLLIAASRERMGGAVNAQTWISWLKKTFAAALRRPCPTLDGNAFKLDWQAIGQSIGAAPTLPPAAPPFLIIDEGQDMPPDFYQALANPGHEHFFVVADQNQQITDQHSTVKAIADALAIDPMDPLLPQDPDILRRWGRP